MNGIISGTPLGPRVTEVTPTDNFELLLKFTNGENRKFDAKPLLELAVFSPLKNQSFFNSVKVDYGTVIWPRDIDCCPDTLYADSIPI